jgi:hypothetical protein
VATDMPMMAHADHPMIQLAAITAIRATSMPQMNVLMFIAAPQVATDGSGRCDILSALIAQSGSAIAPLHRAINVAKICRA